MSEPGNQTERMGAHMSLIAWVLGIGLLTWLFNGYLNRQNSPEPDVQRSGDVRQIVLRRNRQGHYLLAGRVNGRRVVFLLDTGATSITIPGPVAARIGLERGRPYRARTANGVITVYATRIRELRLGNIVLHNVRASINPHMRGQEALLGMSAIKRLEMIQRGNKLILRQRR